MANSIEMSTVVPTFTQPIPVKAGATIQAGAFFAVDDAGRAVPATDATASRMAGRALAEYANTALGALDGDLTVVGERKAYICSNSTIDPVTAADILKMVYADGNNTVRKTRSATQIVAGILIGFDGVFPVLQIVAGEMAAPPSVVQNTLGTTTLIPAQNGLNYVGLNATTGTFLIQLPAALVGLQFNFYLKTSGSGGTYQIKPIPADTVESPAGFQNNAAAKFVQTTSAGNSTSFMQLRCVSPGLWTILDITGAFTREA